MVTEFTPGMIIRSVASICWPDGIHMLSANMLCLLIETVQRDYGVYGTIVFCTPNGKLVIAEATLTHDDTEHSYFRCA